MEEWLQSIVPWGTEVLVSIQALSNDWLDTIFKLFTFLGNEEFYLILLPFVYWCVNRQLGLALGYLAMLSTYLSHVVKYLFNIPRPSDPRLSVPLPETSPSFLSGHTMSAVTNWGYLGLSVRRRLFWVLAVVLATGTSLSRMVLGVHFPQDLVGGLLLGLILLAAYALLAPRAGRWLARQTPGVQLVLAVAGPVLLIFLHPADPTAGYPAEGAIKPMAALVGMGVGSIMERAWVGFSAGGTWPRRGLRFLLGVIIVGLVYAGPKLILPETLPYGVDMAATFARYGLVGWTTAFLGPWLFVRLGLAGREAPAAQAHGRPAGAAALHRP